MTILTSLLFLSPVNKRKTNAQRTVKSARTNLPNTNTPKTNQSAPVSIARNQRTSKPVINVLPNGHCIIKHREYFIDIIGSNVSSFPTVEQNSFIYERINPSNAAVFPWLSGMAGQYETYNFRKLNFEYISTCATSTSGFVIIAIDYDPSDVPPASKVQLLSYEGSVRANSWNAITHRSNKSNLSKQKSYFVGYETMSGPNVGYTRTSDVGNLCIVSMGQSNFNTIGEAYVDYEIEFKTPQMNVITTSMPSLQITMGSTLDFRNYDNTHYYGTLNVRPHTTTELRVFSGFVGTITMLMKGTTIEVPPSVSAIGPNSTVYLGTVINSGLTEAIIIYKVYATPGAVLTFTHGESFTISSFGILFSSLAQNTFDNLQTF